MLMVYLIKFVVMAKSDVFSTSMFTNVYKEVSPIEDLSIDVTPTPHGTCDCVKFNNDVYLLFNQHRLDRMSLQAFSNYLDSFGRADDSLSSLRKNVSDEDLHKFVKSRYIQSRSELLSWSSYLTSQAGEISKEYAEQLKQQQVDNKGDDVELE